VDTGAEATKVLVVLQWDALDDFDFESQLFRHLQSEAENL
jgi:hypothetical protein